MMQGHSDLTGSVFAADDWKNVANPAERRRIQNRLSQRRYRQARMHPDEKSSGNYAVNALVSAQTTSVSNSYQRLLYKFRGLLLAIGSNSIPINTSKVYTKKVDVSPSGILQMTNEFERLVQRYSFLGSPRVDLLLTLVQFNVLRALISNSRSLNWSMEWLECSETISPHFLGSQTGVMNAVPQALLPTFNQLTIPHHPWIDLWPVPGMRDNMLSSVDLDEDALCNVLLEFNDVPHEQTGLVVWGEPWDINSWEVSATFAQHWSWLLIGCVELMASTNQWREKRGESPIILNT